MNVFVDKGQGVTIQARVDDGDWITLGKVDKEIKELNFPSGIRGKKIRFKITEISQTQTFSIEGLHLFYTVESLIE
jgi:hypothetical protein